MKKTLLSLAALVVLALVAVTGGSLYMLDYALSPNPERTDTAQRFALLFDEYPETRPWVDSLRRRQALRDTFLTMPSGERHHAYLVDQQPRSALTAVLVHGWRDQAIGMFPIARLYHHMGYNLVLPDLHAHGLSQGEAIGMGWHERLDVLHWMRQFLADTMVVHGVSMGAATAMNVAGEQLPQGIKSISFVEDCGYTSVWDEFCHKMADEFALPPFPLLYTSSWLCQVMYGWNFSQASSLRQLSSSRHPMLFIHGDDDNFVPSGMVSPLFRAKPALKWLWITRNTQHAESYKNYREEYARRLRSFLKR